MAKNRNAKHTADAGLVKESAAHKPLGRYNFMGMAFAGILIVTGFLLMLGGSSTEEADYAEQVTVRIMVPCEEKDAVIKEITEATAGRAQITVAEPGYYKEE